MLHLCTYTSNQQRLRPLRVTLCGLTLAEMHKGVYKDFWQYDPQTYLSHATCDSCVLMAFSMLD